MEFDFWYPGLDPAKWIKFKNADDIRHFNTYFQLNSYAKQFPTYKPSFFYLVDLDTTIVNTNIAA